MKIKLTARKPRNPLVAASLQRVAGPHGCRSANAKARREGREAVRRELQSTPQRAAPRDHDPHRP